ncbi:beta-ketoacyl-[acyl-carrier-protein] synthase II [Blastopirellula marina]|uniref:3-oxoacyl-[acyl-carrier-protein] synthase 2 n=2 Tax=Blastopirellula marina TaxID=124 RepID=A0A2S8GEF9_9BACT|nr:beta-ketoacyl-ACP synthase II [Blastopirellula marina]PQO42803.1 beta-ketoacyl-[acyl-carrier-protein] synthase II [Blastopirellula marina]PTL46569.1 beta-ketoacyl-[acyl-carrier-protein] synthase II [Blastopirellula marina]
MKRRVVVTGMGIVSSLSCQLDTFWSKLIAGESGIHEIKILDTSRFKVKFAADVHDWAPDVYIDSKEQKRLDRFSQFGMVAGIDAVSSSGLDFSQEDSYRCGVILGSGVGGIATIEEQTEKLLTKGADRVSPMTIPRLMLNAAGGNISIRYGLRGPNYTVATACASATNALGDALKAIQYDEADVMISGGTEAGITPMGISAFSNMKALSFRNDDPVRASRPFDLDRDGFVMAEGAGVVVLEELEHAKARGANILAELVGFGCSGDGGHITSPDPEGRGAARAMQNALNDAALDPQKIDYINAHGTSTPPGDKAETIAIKTVYGDHAYKLAVSSTKSSLGHSLGASGGIELIACIKAINEGIIPPTINLTKPDPACDLDYTPNEAKNRKVCYAMSNSFGFGGHNACVIAKEYTE